MVSGDDETGLDVISECFSKIPENDKTALEMFGISD